MCFHSISNRFFTVLRLMIALIFCTARMGFADDSTDLFSQGKAESEQKYYARVIDQARDSFQKGKYDDAIADCNKIILLSDYLPAYVLRGCAYSKLGNYDKVISDFNHVIRFNPDKSAYLLQGDAYMKKGDYTNALADFNEAINLDPAQSSSYFERGNAFLAVGNYDKALADYSKSLGNKPESAIYFGRGRAYAGKGDLDKAIADYDEALRLKPDSQVYKCRGWAYAQKGDADQAVADYNEAIKLNPSDAESHAIRGLLYSGKGDYARGIADCRKGVLLDTNCASACNNLAWLLTICPDAKLRNGREAVDYARKACELGAWKEPHALGTLAAAYAEMGDFQQAVRWQNKCMEAGLPAREMLQARRNLDLFLHNKTCRAEK